MCVVTADRYNLKIKAKMEPYLGKDVEVCLVMY